MQRSRAASERPRAGYPGSQRATNRGGGRDGGAESTIEEEMQRSRAASERPRAGYPGSQRATKRGGGRDGGAESTVEEVKGGGADVETPRRVPPDRPHERK